VSPDQRVRLDVLRETPAEVYVWKPSDWPEIDRVLRLTAVRVEM
jgi:hypothetical protein